MSDNKKNVYGTPGDTTFRKKYDREEYAQRAKDRESASRNRHHSESHPTDSKAATPHADSKDSKDSKPPSSHHHKHRHVTPPPSGASTTTTSRSARLDLTTQLNKTTLVPAGASAVGKRGRGVGFYCDACDLTYKDSLQWVDHLNSKQHLYNSGETGEVVRATLEMVRDRLEALRRRRREEDEARRLGLGEGGGVDLKKRLEERRRLEEEERRVKREERRVKRREGKGKVKVEDGAVQAGEGGGGAGDGVEVMELDEDAAAMARMMGFSGTFGSTKKS